MIKVLYLANYATTHNSIGEFDLSPVGNQSIYHQEIFNLLKDSGLIVVPSRDAQTLIDKWSEFDYVFSLLNRTKYKGYEVLISALCEYFGLPYLGARPNVRAVAEDKQVAKPVAKQLGFTVARSKIYQRSTSIVNPPEFAGPYIAKPRYGAASKNMTEACIQDLWQDLIPEVQRLLDVGDDVIVEEFIAGTNLSIPVLGGSSPSVLPGYLLWSSKKGQLVTFEQKRHLDSGLKRSLFENPSVYDHLRKPILALYSELQPLDYFRVDFRLTKQDKPVFLEFNVCCNIGSKSGFSFSAKQTGLSHQEMVINILRQSLSRQKIAW
jgi:D-alanine-D-alanine ligase